jgi:hypothetical protein
MTSNHHHLGMIDQKNNKTTATWQHADEMLYQYLKQRVKNHYEPKRVSIQSELFTFSRYSTRIMYNNNCMYNTVCTTGIVVQCLK